MTAPTVQAQRQPPALTKTAGGTFDPTDRHHYFLAANLSSLVYATALQQIDHILVAVNEIQAPGDYDLVDRWLDEGKKVLLDSGIFWLTNEHKRAHGITMDEALALPPEAIDGFDGLLEKYLRLVARWGDRVWGYIELDQGGREQKKKTRAMLEGRYGLRPMPVYHPLNDGWDYFDELAERYDRICFGNVVQAMGPTRKRLISTAWERHRKYPDLWIHLLGYTPNQWLNAMPADNCDSSSWLVGVRWTRADNEAAAGQWFTRMVPGFAYRLPKDLPPEMPPEEVKAVLKRGHRKAHEFLAYRIWHRALNWQAYVGRAEELFGATYPAPVPGHDPRPLSLAAAEADPVDAPVQVEEPGPPAADPGGAPVGSRAVAAGLVRGLSVPAPARSGPRDFTPRTGGDLSVVRSNVLPDPQKVPRPAPPGGAPCP